MSVLSWLNKSWNSSRRAQSCCCWMTSRWVGIEGLHMDATDGAPGGSSISATVSNALNRCPRCRWRGSEHWLWTSSYTSVLWVMMGALETCCNTRVQPMSALPWLNKSWNSSRRARSCCCWMTSRWAGMEGLHMDAADGASGGSLICAIISNVPNRCPRCRWKGSERWLWTASHTSVLRVKMGARET